jgi:general secretion pathway protein K
MMKAEKFNCATPRSDGFILVAVLWMLGLLSAVVSIYAIFVIDSAKGLPFYDERLQADALVLAALELTAYRQLNTVTQSRPTQGQFSFRLGGANVAVEFRSEVARIDLNAAPKPLLAGLFIALGARPDDAEMYSDRVVSWRTSPSAGEKLSPPGRSYIGYRQREGRFPHPYELTLLPGLPPALAQRALRVVTVYNGRPQVNVRDAAPEVLAALPGMSEKRVSAVLMQRQTAPRNGESLLQLLGASQQYATLEGNNALRVRVNITFDNGRRANSEVVILVFEAGDEPFSIFSWRDEL